MPRVYPCKLLLVCPRKVLLRIPFLAAFSFQNLVRKGDALGVVFLKPGCRSDHGGDGPIRRESARQSDFFLNKPYGVAEVFVPIKILDRILSVSCG
jgi:hypothetical protein